MKFFLKQFLTYIVFFMLSVTSIYANNCSKWLLISMEGGLHTVIPIYDKSIIKPDLDCDGIIDILDHDIDGDGVNNEIDAFPFNVSETKDTDGDGIGDNADKPVAYSQTITILKNSHDNTILLSGHDNDENITFTISMQPIHGTLSGTIPNLIFTPTTDYIGSDSFSFQTNDGVLSSNIATVSIDIKPSITPTPTPIPNSAPIGVDDNISIVESTAVTIDVLSNDSDANGDSLSITNLSTPSHGNVSVVSDTVVYTPEANWSGTDSFTYTPYDGQLAGNSTNVSILVESSITPTPTPTPTPIPNSAPVGVDDNISIVESTAVTIDILSNDSDANGDSLSITNLSTPSHGNVSVVLDTVVYIPEANWSGTDSFTYTPYDGQLAGNSTNVTIQVILEESIEDKIVKRHNVYRNLVFTDSNVTWDTTLAQHAQQWADYLASHYTQAHQNDGQSPHASVFNVDSHGLPYEDEGENIAWSSNGRGYLTPNPVDITVVGAGEGGSVDAWANEKAYYDYENNTGNGHVVGHYTQVVWQKTTKVGCGKANSTTDLGGEHVVCRYYIAGNLGSDKPYCTQYSVAVYYNDTTLQFTDAMLNGKTFQNTKVLEDRVNCTVSDLTGETLLVNNDGSGTFQAFDFFNNGNYVTNFHFTKTIDTEGTLEMTGVVDGHNARMILKLIGQDTAYYYADAVWTLDTNNAGYTRRSIFKLAK